ncbi:hypothetical protein QBC46DRAFT_396249 [Diplogelasinospora grovesii]|uniref:Extracellular serine-rich protein n=1 Tax=Diplogelasinospora grovesii TaxID=303347 RepID=A0AAN6MZD1_9PEZI|nr:hypothetical protein QBC46DRAFT_396249 [Diplogelasinospora grovesii]
MRYSSLLLLPLPLLASIAEATNYVVTVGKDSQLKFVPETLNAVVGDTVTYQFFAKNHSVTQSSFADPCHPLAGGFFSGFNPSASTDTASPTTWTITVNDTKPIWVYCGQTTGNHCQSGMVHAINAPTSGNTIDAFKASAAKASTSTSPPDGLPVGGLRKLHIDVGLGGNLTFSPNNVTNALPRTVVEFSFNPKNHSVVQSSFSDPCHPLANGFSSGFIPTEVSPSGVLFDIVVQDTKPIWFYCAQTAKTHCQAGMVGSINAPTSGNTLDAFIQLAAKASTSTIPPQAPLVGTVTVNGAVISSFNGAVLNSDTTLSSGAVPPPGSNVSSYMTGMAGGGQPGSYNWAPNISDNATDFLQLLQFLDDILLEVLFQGFEKLNTGGSWAGVYPQSIVDTIGSMSAQALVHRSTATDSLQHYQKTMLSTCSYNLAPSFSVVDDFLHAALILLLLEIGVLIDITALVAAADPWLVPALATQLGAKSRMTAVINMMQNHMAASAVREVMIPAPLAWSYAMNNYVSSCPDTIKSMPSKPYPAMKVTNTQQSADGSRTTNITVQVDSGSAGGGGLFIAWIGPWGGLEYSAVGSDGSSAVPTDLYGHVWAVLVNKSGGKLQDLPGVTVAGPELVWVSQP